METPTKVSACQGLLAQGSIRGEGGEGIFSDRARQRSFVFFFFFLEGEHNEGQLARTISNMFRDGIARTRSIEMRIRPFPIYCDRQLTESASVTLTDSRARDRVGGETEKEVEVTSIL